MLLVVVLAVAAAFGLVMWASSSDHVSTADAPGRPSSASPRPRDVAGTAAATVEAPPARPLALSIPAIGVRTHVVRLGQHPDGTVEVPGDPAQVGWFALGPPPGAAGSSVILGHVDSTRGPAVFYRLKELRPGDGIAVRLDDGTTVRFRVHSVRTYLNADFPAEKVYGKQGRSQLNLVTCGGAYDAARGGYQSNVVVSSRRTG
jgi:LPXTG-site transpeptidase (sortase) family protein